MKKKAFKYFDLQANGYSGIDFNSMILTEEQLLFACNKLEEDNVDGILITLITDDFDNMVWKIKNLVSIIENNNVIKSIVKGLHIEGPFLNSNDGYRGAHPQKYIIPADLERAKQILENGNGFIKLFTIAPETDKHFEIIKFLSEKDVVVSAGHTNASFEQLNGAIDNGLKLFTHLGNGSPSILPRHDNIVNRVLSLAGKISICFIADGIHIPSFALKNYLKAADLNNCIIVTDCMAAASAPPGRYSVSHINVEVGKDKIVREIGNENLAGSAITMKDAESFLTIEIGLTKDECHQLLALNPKKILSENI